MSVDIITFGCRLNSYESEVMKNHALAAGLHDTIVFNTWSVTAQAEKQARQAIRKARRENPNARIVVTGCAAQINPKQFSEMNEVDAVLGNQEKMEGKEWQLLTSPIGRGRRDNVEPGEGLTTSPFALTRNSLREFRPLPMGEVSEKTRVNDIMSVKETASHLVASFDGKARAFIQVQNGCNHRCTFCIIPFGRGNSRSVPMGEIVAQVRALVEAGYNEIVFTGVDVSDYGQDLPGAPTLGQMMRRVLTLVPELPRLRLSSIDAVEVADALCPLIAADRSLMRHLHVSLRHDIIAFCDKVRALRPDIVFGADIIAGFPTETDAMFENTLRLVDEVELTYLHVFPYSARPGTPAAKMPQVKAEIRKARAAQLRDAGKRQLQHYLAAQLGKEVTLVVEQDGISGHGETFIPVRLNEPRPVGSLQRVTIAYADATQAYTA